jgi:hypothetical protein
VTSSIAYFILKYGGWRAVVSCDDEEVLLCVAGSSVAFTLVRFAYTFYTVLVTNLEPNKWQPVGSYRVLRFWQDLCFFLQVSPGHHKTPPTLSKPKLYSWVTISQYLTAKNKWNYGQLTHNAWRRQKPSWTLSEINTRHVCFLSTDTPTDRNAMQYNRANTKDAQHFVWYLPTAEDHVMIYKNWTMWRGKKDETHVCRRYATFRVNYITGNSFKTQLLGKTACKELPVPYNTCSFITVFTGISQWPLCWASWLKLTHTRARARTHALFH